MQVVAHVLCFEEEKVRQDHVHGVVSGVAVGSGLEVTVREQQGRRMKHEKGEDEMERNVTHMQTPFWHPSALSHACM